LSAENLRYAQKIATGHLHRKVKEFGMKSLQAMEKRLWQTETCPSRNLSGVAGIGETLRLKKGLKGAGYDEKRIQKLLGRDYLRAKS